MANVPKEDWCESSAAHATVSGRSDAFSREDRVAEGQRRSRLKALLLPKAGNFAYSLRLKPFCGGQNKEQQ